MGILLLDTCVIVDHLNNRSGQTACLSRWVTHNYRLACCTVNVTEVYAGLRRGEERAVETLFESLELLAITRAVAARAGLLRNQWRKRGHTLGYAEVTIAAVALEYDVNLMTGNRRHFPMPELRLLAPDATPGR